MSDETPVRFGVFKLMVASALDKSINWPHKRQSSKMEVVVDDEVAAELPNVRVTSGSVFDALVQLKAALKEPEKYPRVTIVYAEDS